MRMENYLKMYLLFKMQIFHLAILGEKKPLQCQSTDWSFRLEFVDGTIWWAPTTIGL